MISPSVFFTWKKLNILDYCTEIYFLKILIRKCKAPEFYKYCQKSKVNVTGLEITADLKKIYIYRVIWVHFFLSERWNKVFVYNNLY